MDYLKFKDTIAFDKICNNLGDLLAGFMEKFLNGEGMRGIDKLNDLRLNLFAEKENKPQRAQRHF
jgi:hypothetical protein